jgi:hypothetical protein
MFKEDSIAIKRIIKTMWSLEERGELDYGLEERFWDAHDKAMLSNRHFSWGFWLSRWSKELDKAEKTDMPIGEYLN